MPICILWKVWQKMLYFLKSCLQVCFSLRHSSKTRDLCEETEKTYPGLNSIPTWSIIQFSDHVINFNFQPVNGNVSSNLCFHVLGSYHITLRWMFMASAAAYRILIVISYFSSIIVISCFSGVYIYKLNIAWRWMFMASAAALSVPEIMRLHVSFNLRGTHNDWSICFDDIFQWYISTKYFKNKTTTWEVQ